MLEKLKLEFAKYLHKKLQEHIKNRPPDFTVGSAYLKRWWLLPRNRFFNVYYHNFRVSDDDRALHDHEYINVSFLLDGEYIEHTEKGVFHRKTGALVMRRPSTLHRIELLPNVSSRWNEKECPTWTLFITGPRVRTWGFKIDNQWLDYKTYIAKYGAQLNN
ncbi:MAG: hypothetical protein JWP44_5018 [Mucilaginibacter sp.]|nr:hypothetical protein [Mucilaginibacter sp.]